VVPVTLLIIFLLLYLNFRRLTETLIVMLSLPFARQLSPAADNRRRGSGTAMCQQRKSPVRWIISSAMASEVHILQ
jgi:hypothetical protein